MPDKTEDLGNTEYDANRRARANQAGSASPSAEDPTGTPLSVPSETPDVGLSQKGTGEDAIVRRETEI